MLHWISCSGALKQQAAVPKQQQQQQQQQVELLAARSRCKLVAPMLRLLTAKAASTHAHWYSTRHRALQQQCASLRAMDDSWSVRSGVGAAVAVAVAMRCWVWVCLG